MRQRVKGGVRGVRWERQRRQKRKIMSIKRAHILWLESNAKRLRRTDPSTFDGRVKSPFGASGERRGESYRVIGGGRK